MKSRLADFTLLLLALALFFCVRADALVTMDALLNERLTVPNDGQAHAFVFSPTANNLYVFESFGEGRAAAQLYLEGETEPIAEADGFSFEARLIADATYRLVVEVRDAPVEVELMRSALGRSFAQPIELSDLSAGYDKVIARAYDTHWFRFTAQVSGLYVIRSSSQINTVGYLLDEAGRRLSVSDNLYSPYCLDFRLQRQLEAGRTYYVRVSGRGEETGAYHLVLTAPEEWQPPPESIQLGAQSLSLEEGGTARLTYAVQPQGAIDDAVFISADPDVAHVSATGEVVARSAGRTQIILSGAAGVEARCPVTVAPVPVTGVEAASAAIEVHAGEPLELGYRVLPERASNRAVRFTSSDEAVVSVGSDGTLTAQAPGEAVVTITAQDGGFTADVSVTVLRARSRYRALVMGEHGYDHRDVRIGSINTTQGVADLFGNQSYDGLKCEVTVKLDSTRGEALRAIREAFRDAAPTDVSILYINCHGGLTGREPWLEFHDGSRLTASQLERALRKVKGAVVLMIDCCQSGAFLSDEAATTFNRRMVQIFSASASSPFASSKYRLLCSASSAQDSYRISTENTLTENLWATAFGRSLCEAGGWDLIGNKPTRMRADLNQDRKVTLFEAYLYVARRVNNYLSRRKVRQDVQVYPAGSPLVLFQR